jgi:Ca-activated chloride channel family protein
MRRVRAVIAAAVLLIGADLVAQQPPVYRADIQTVPVYVTVVGGDGHLVTDLTRGDFEIRDNGRPEPITLFDNSIQPISIVVMLDMSGSMSGNLGVLRSAAVQMFTRLLPADKARVGSFGNRIVISPETFTNDVDQLTRALWFDLDPGGPTPLWGAVNAAMAALARLDGRRVVLVLTDGKNTGLRMVNGLVVGPTLKETIERAETEDFMVYAIGMRSRELPFAAGRGGPGGRGGFGGRFGGGFGASHGESDEPDPGLKEIAADSGGGYFALTVNDDPTSSSHGNLGPVFAQVADELHRQYLLGYAPPESDGRVHHIEVRLKDPTMRARARQSYRAPGRSAE